MSAPERRAVFLSYASQDAPAVERLAEALRAEGVEVWFDRNELVGGDAWDAKIRKQIAECALFVPIVSANTQARDEGYFRLEWKLAADRTHLMAHDKAFLLPVVIDATTDAAARVPPEFKQVQWTHLRQGYGGQARVRPLGSGALAPDEAALGAFCRRVKQLLGGDVAGVADSGRVRKAAPASARPATTKSARPWFVPVALGLATVVVVAAFLSFRSKPEAGAGARPTATEKSAPLTEARKLVRQARALFDSGDYVNREDIFLAEDILKKAQLIDNTDAEVWAAQADLSRQMIIFGYERTSVRHELLRQQSERAYKLAPEAIESQIAYGGYLQWAGKDSAEEATRLMESVIARDPENRKAYRVLSMAWSYAGDIDRAMAAAYRSHALPGGDPVGLMMGAAQLQWWGRYAEIDSAIAQADAVRVTGRSLVLRALLDLFWRGDLDEAAAVVEKWPVWMRLEDRGAFVASQVWLWRREPDKAIAVLSPIARDSFFDTYYMGPKAVLLALAHEMANRPQAARDEWANAKRVAVRVVAEQPSLKRVLALQALAMAKLGEKAEAEALLRSLEQGGALRSEYWSCAHASALLRLALGHTEAVSSGLNSDPMVDMVGRKFPAPRAALELNPAYDSVRATPAFQQLLAAAPAPPQRAAKKLTTDPAPAERPAPEKSIAVLAFKNLSDDRNQEYFSDGLSEELSNALGRVPGLFVLGSTSAFSVKGQSLPVPEIARKLGVAYVVEGTVRPAGQSVRVTARLLRGTDGLQVWSSGNLNREVRDSLALQEELAGLIAQQLSLKLGAAPAGAVAAVNPEAYRLYLEGLQAWSRRSGIAGEDEEVLRAQARFGRALALAPDFARAQAAFADTWVLLFDGRYRNFSPDAAELGARARREVERALVLGAELGEVQATHARLLLAERRYAESAAAFQRAIQANPNYAYARQWYGRLLCNRGRLEEGLAEMKLATQLDPFSPIVTSNYALYLNMARRWPEVLTVADRVLAIAPDYGQTLGARAHALIGLSRLEEARQVLRAEAGRKRSLSGDLRILVARLLAGEQGELIQEAEARLAKPADLRLSEAVRLALALGRTEEAFRFARERPGEWRADSALYFFFPGYDGVRDDPRFTQWLEDAGCRREYEQAWAEHRAWRRRTGTEH